MFELQMDSLNQNLHSYLDYTVSCSFCLPIAKNEAISYLLVSKRSACIPNDLILALKEALPNHNHIEYYDSHSMCSMLFLDDAVKLKKRSEQH